MADLRLKKIKKTKQ